ncbi:MAG: hypothetical protein ACI82A_000227 [Candidatus Azotimanducaceae bacterium]|jgi:hypothetical protein
MALTWQIDSDNPIILLKFSQEVLSSDLETYNVVLAADPKLTGYDQFIDFGEINCDELVYMVLVSGIEQWIKTTSRWHRSRIALSTSHASQNQLARFFCAVKDLVPGSEAIDFYTTDDKADALAWLSRDRSEQFL